MAERQGFLSGYAGNPF
jgi:hypothetical protein